jgi:hypothetical protein
MVGAWTGDAIRRPCHASPSSPLDVTSAFARYLAGLPARPALGATPTKRHVTADWPLPASHVEALGPYQHSEYEANPRRRPGRNAARANLAPGFRGFWHFPDLRGKFADPEREIPDISGKFPVHQSREFAAKSLILRKYSETGSYVTACTTIQSSRTSQTVNDRKEAFFCGDLAACF